jgi:hypothetical protein
MADADFIDSKTPLPTPDPGVVYCKVEEGAVLLSTGQEVYFGLNGVGARIWALLPPSNDSLEDLCVALGKDFPEVDTAVLRADVTELLEELARNGLVR